MKLLKWILLMVLILGLGCVYYFQWYQYLSFDTLKKNHQILAHWAENHYFLSVLLFMCSYILAVAFSIPGAIFLTIIGGFLFGPLGTLYVVISATIGATIIFLAVKSTLGEFLANKATGWIEKMEKGFQENAFNYLLALRLIPLFPFWAINMVAGLLSVRLKTFMLATFIGIIPGSFVYVMVGNSLMEIIRNNQKPNLTIIFSPIVFFPLVGLALLTLLPMIYKKWKGNSYEKIKR